MTSAAIAATRPNHCNTAPNSTIASSDIPIEFPVPSDQPTTNLAATPPTYWEIAANGKARGVDYEAVFLVPVYKVS